MYSCPNCSAGLRFDIARQALFCDSCDSVFDPYSMQKETIAEERQYFEVTTFTCPMCGGEIISEDNEAAAFCSYCGGSTLLESRISMAKRPFYIIPFKKTKQDCVESYKKMIGKVVFADKEVKDPKNIESFRGIYMPYWTYRYEKNGPVAIEGTKTYQRGNYEYTEHHSLGFTAQISYDNISYDAASAFADNLSAAIAPYDQNEQVPFTPAFLSGFYADASDVAGDVYINDGASLVADDCFKQIKRVPPISKYSVKEKAAEAGLKPDCTNGKLCMFPVWFMCLRTKDKKGEERVSYSVVNGQTGVAAGDVPISLSKYILISAIAGAVLFLILNFIFNITPSPKTVTWISLIGTIVMYGIYCSREKKIQQRLEGTDDAGLVSVQKAEIPKEKKKVKNPRTFVWISWLIAGIIFFVNPVGDEPYYLSSAVSMALIIKMIIQIVGRFNKLTTRKLPQFNRTGGDDSAQNIQ